MSLSIVSFDDCAISCIASHSHILMSLGLHRIKLILAVNPAERSDLVSQWKAWVYFLFHNSDVRVSLLHMFFCSTSR